MANAEMKYSIVTVKNIDRYGLRIIDSADLGADIFKVVHHHVYISAENNFHYGLYYTENLNHAKQCVRDYERYDRSIQEIA